MGGKISKTKRLVKRKGLVKPKRLVKPKQTEPKKRKNHAAEKSTESSSYIERLNGDKSRRITRSMSKTPSNQSSPGDPENEEILENSMLNDSSETVLDILGMPPTDSELSDDGEEEEERMEEEEEEVAPMMTTDFSIPRLPFKRCVREIFTEISPDLRLQTEALNGLQEASEQYLVQLFEDASLLAHYHQERVTIHAEDMRSVQMLCGFNRR